MRANSIALLVSPLVLWSAAASAQPPAPIVAVFMMESRGSPLKGDELVGLTDYMATKLGEGGQFQIIPRDEIRKRLVAARLDSHKDCVEQSCQIEIGRELAAQYTISSTISRVGNKCLITGQLYDLRKAATAGSATSKKDCQADNLIIGVEEIVSKLKASMSGGVVRQPEPIAQPEPIVEPEPIQSPEPIAQPDLGAPSDTPVQEPVDPDYTPVYKRWWFWTLIVGGVIVTGVVIYFVVEETAYAYDYSYLQRGPAPEPSGLVFRF
jgi:TolB-like protein